MKKLKKILCVFMTLCCCAVIASALGCSSSLVIVGEPKMRVEYNSYLGYSAEISGVIKNNSFGLYDYVQVEFVVYDENGNNLGTALDNMNNLGAGETWRFNASLFSFPNARPASFKLVEITYW